MTYQATVVRVLIASPGDTVNERRVLREAIEDWNSLHGELGVYLQPMMWEREATPENRRPGPKPFDGTNETSLRFSAMFRGRAPKKHKFKLAGDGGGGY